MPLPSGQKKNMHHSIFLLKLLVDIPPLGEQLVKLMRVKCRLKVTGPTPHKFQFLGSRELGVIKKNEIRERI